jgi:hypothetical protein
MILMLPAIQFNHDFPFNTREIGNVFPDGMLPSKAVAVELFVA